MNKLADLLIDSNERLDEPLYIGLGEFILNVQSNSNELLDKLRGYFSHAIVEPHQGATSVIAIERSAVDLDMEFRDWKREPNKSARKDSYIDVDNTRLIRKVRTGMVFLQSKAEKIAAGPCLKNDNQVINFINAQCMNYLQNHGYAICHAAAVVVNGFAIGMAGFSGGGKSTLMLQLLNSDHISYMTNDRLFVKSESDQVQACGIPKLPRVNPGTIVHHPKLKKQLLTEQQCQAYLNLPRDELWDLEEKHDVMVEQVFGKDKIRMQAPLNTFLVLNWDRNSSDALQVNRVDLNQRRDLLQAIMKSPGPFYQHNDESFHQDSRLPDEQQYISTFANVAVYEATGQVNFVKLADICLDKLVS